MRASMIFTLFYWFMCKHLLKYVTLNRKDWLKNISLEAAMLVNVSEAYSTSAISIVYQFGVWLGSSDMNLRHSLWMKLTLIGQRNTNGAALESWRFVVDHELRCQVINYYDIL